MVALTMTAAIVEALETMPVLARDAIQEEFSTRTPLGPTAEQSSIDPRAAPAGEAVIEITSQEPSLLQPKLGNPISHSQVVDLWKQLKAQDTAYSLDRLLRGARVYVPPPPHKSEPTPEYKALMARLRREEEERSYDRMTNPPPSMETFRQRFPASSAAHAFSSNHYPAAQSDPFAETDEVTYADVDRQMALVFNVLVSIIACAGAIWVAARWWSTPTRLALSMSGSILVGVAEVVVYSGYVRRVGESKGKEKAKKEVKEVVKTWVLGGDKRHQRRGDDRSVESKADNGTAIRRRERNST